MVKVKDIIKSSKKLQQLFTQRCVELDITPEKVCNKASVDYQLIKAWIDAGDPDTAKVVQSDIIEVFKVLHVDVTLTVGVLPVDKLTEEQINELKK